MCISHQVKIAKLGVNVALQQSVNTSGKEVLRNFSVGNTY